MELFALIARGCAGPRPIGTQPNEAGADRRGGVAERIELFRIAGKRNRKAHDDDGASDTIAKRVSQLTKEQEDII